MLSDTVVMCEVYVNIPYLVPKFDWTVKFTNASWLDSSQVGQGGEEWLTLGYVPCLMICTLVKTVFLCDG